MKTQRPRMRLRHFQRGIELHPTPEGWTGVTNASRWLGHPAEARRTFDAALALDADSIGALLGSASARALDSPQPDRDEVARAREEVEQVLSLRPALPEGVQLLARIAEVEARL